MMHGNTKLKKNAFSIVRADVNQAHFTQVHCGYSHVVCYHLPDGGLYKPTAMIARSEASAVFCYRLLGLLFRITAEA